MYCMKQVKKDLFWVGGNDRRLSVFEGVYKVPYGMSYNSYLLMDEKTVLMDTVDKAVEDIFFENIHQVLGGRALDYLVIQHMEPDHSSAAARLLSVYPEARLVCNAKTLSMLNQFFGTDFSERAMLVKEGDTLKTGTHELMFLMAPMVHWPEVMVTYDKAGQILFSADAFGTFGALNGAVFADEVDFEKDYMDEARRYYTNIVGKYGVQVQALLQKAAGVGISMICPLHGFVWRKDAGVFLEKYQKWSSYTPEEKGVVIAYGSIYGNTENAAEILSSMLRDMGIKTVMYDVSVTAESEVIAAAFRYSHLVFASATYNSGVFVCMENLLHDLAAHNIQNRTIAFMQNGSWAATCTKKMQEILAGLKNTVFLEEGVTIKSSVKHEQMEEIKILAEKIKESV